MAETSSLLRNRTSNRTEGSNPSLSAISFSGWQRTVEVALNRKDQCAAVAQLDRVPGYEPGGRRFESSQPRHYFGTLFRAPLTLRRTHKSDGI